MWDSDEATITTEEVQSKTANGKSGRHNRATDTGGESVDDERSSYNGKAIPAYPRRNNEERDGMTGERATVKKTRNGQRKLIVSTSTQRYAPP